MNNINFKKEVSLSVEAAIAKTTEELSKIGFGILTRIDFHSKIKEKLGETISPVVILGACNPRFAYEAFKYNTDVTSLIPCNAVIRDLGHGKTSVEIAKATAMIATLGDKDMICMAEEIDGLMEKALEQIH